MSGDPSIEEHEEERSCHFLPHFRLSLALSLDHEHVSDTELFSHQGVSSARIFGGEKGVFRA